MSDLNNARLCRQNSSPVSAAIILEERFEELADGSLFSPSGFGDAIWQRYVDVLGPIAVIARVTRAEIPSPRSMPITSPSVSVLGIPSFIGPVQFLTSLPAVKAAMGRAMAQPDRFILRAPGTLSLLAEPHLKRTGKPYAVELVGDPVDVFQSLGKAASMLKPVFASGTRRLCASAEAVSYVTREALQSRYPAAEGAYTTHYSSIELPIEMIRPAPRGAADFSEPTFRLLQVGSLEQLYKGTDVLIAAIALLVTQGERVSLRIVGDGRYRNELERLVREKGLNNHIAFLGRRTREEVLEEMDAAHMLVQPSRTEGLPRTVIEAFSRAMPVIGSRIGGIPELVPEEHLVMRDDPRNLADAIAACIGKHDMLAAMSHRNLGVAVEYRADILSARRRAFYERLAAADPRGNRCA